MYGKCPKCGDTRNIYTISKEDGDGRYYYTIDSLPFGEPLADGQPR